MRVSFSSIAIYVVVENAFVDTSIFHGMSFNKLLILTLKEMFLQQGNALNEYSSNKSV